MHTLPPPNLTIASSQDLPPEKLHAFYRAMYPHLSDEDFLRLAWLYHDAAPVVALDGENVVAHAARIPFTLMIAQKPHRCSWYVDFAVLPAYQGQGLGKRLTKVWMAYAETQVSFCNEKSMGVFRQFGWVESFRPLLHFLPLAPFDHRRFHAFIPGFLRGALNLIPKIYFKRCYRRQGGDSELKMLPVDAVALAHFQKFFQPPESAIVPLRDTEYFSWRLLRSPHCEHYRMVHLATQPSIQAVIKINRRNQTSYVDILCLSKPLEVSANTTLLAQIADWAGQNAIAYVRLLTCDPAFSKHLKSTLHSFCTPHRFTFFATDPHLKDFFQTAPWHFELIDSDWEQFS